MRNGLGLICTVWDDINLRFFIRNTSALCKCEKECASLADFRFYPGRAAVHLGNLLHNRQPDAGPLDWMIHAVFTNQYREAEPEAALPEEFLKRAPRVSQFKAGSDTMATFDAGGQ
jgi:hypothetical protein